MLTKSQLLRFSMAAGMYLLLMWGYLTLPDAQWYAAFLALMMSSMLVFWVSEATEAATKGSHRSSLTKVSPTYWCQSGLSRPGHSRPGLTMSDWESRYDSPCGGELSFSVQDLQLTVARLDELKLELAQQYAQFGRDQSALNRSCLGSWHRRNDQRRPL